MLFQNKRDYFLVAFLPVNSSLPKLLYSDLLINNILLSHEYSRVNCKKVR